MNLNLLARVALVVPILLVLGCGSATSRRPAVVELGNNTNVVMTAGAGSGTLGTIERLDPALDELLAPDAKLEILVKGLDWAEGPVWSKGEKCLLFSDVPQNVVYRWSEREGVSVYLKPSGYWGSTPRGGEPGSNGLTFDPQGRLVLCQHGERRVARLEKDGRLVTVVDSFGGKRFNSPNDLIFDSRGDLWFTDPPYGLEGKLADAKKEIPFQGVYRYSAAGRLTLFTKEIKFPNGIAMSPDENTLYVAASDPERPVVWAFDRAGGEFKKEPRVFFDASALAAKKLKGLPDGMKVDERG
ncbi:MAG: gluconolactonase, partial [Phycisphaerales bacterium]|nr:gluconolactonase [Phycisphaerales bacterium]